MPFLDGGSSANVHAFRLVDRGVDLVDVVPGCREGTAPDTTIKRPCPVCGADAPTSTMMPPPTISTRELSWSALRSAWLSRSVRKVSTLSAWGTPGPHRACRQRREPRTSKETSPPLRSGAATGTRTLRHTLVEPKLDLLVGVLVLTVKEHLWELHLSSEELLGQIGPSSSAGFGRR